MSAGRATSTPAGSRSGRPASEDPIEEGQRRWEAEVAGPALSKSPERKEQFATLGGIPVSRVYTPRSPRSTFDGVGYPGQPPFTRGIHPTMYRGRVWSMRMFSGFGSPEDTNRRFHYLLKHGESGLSIAFDDPTLYGIDADDPEALGEVGKCGVNVGSLADMRRLLRGIPLADVTTSMTINAPANIVWGMYLLAGEANGVPPDRLGGTTQNDILKEYIAQKEFVYPPRPALRLVIDTIEYATRTTPRWNPVSISGYHIREAGSTALQELAFTLADGRAYVGEAIRRGLDVDEFAPRLSFFFNSHNDFFEEIAKFRAARRLWARVMREEFHATKERSLWLRFHTQTAGCSCTAQQPELNIVRTTIQALAGVLGGTQSLHTNSYERGAPAPERGRGADRAAHSADPRVRVRDRGVGRPVRGQLLRRVAHRHDGGGGPEVLRTDRLPGRGRPGDRARVLPAGDPRVRRSATNGRSSPARRRSSGSTPTRSTPQSRSPGSRSPEEARRGQSARLRSLRSRRNKTRYEAALDRLRKVAATEDENTMPAVLDALRADRHARRDRPGIPGRVRPISGAVERTEGAALLGERSCPLLPPHLGRPGTSGSTVRRSTRSIGDGASGSNPGSG